MCGFQEKEEEEAEKREREYVERMAAERLASLEGGDNLDNLKLHIDQELMNGKVPDPSASEKPWTFEKNPLWALVL